MTTDKTAAIAQCPPPDNIKQTRQLLGLANFFRDHIKDFAKLSAPLFQLTKNNSGYTKGELPPTAKEAFDILKYKLTHAPILALPDNPYPFELYTDAATGGENDGRYTMPMKERKSPCISIRFQNNGKRIIVQQ